jgi:hypothetical protein
MQTAAAPLSPLSTCLYNAEGTMACGIVPPPLPFVFEALSDPAYEKATSARLAGCPSFSPADPPRVARPSS